jgi:cell division protein FtsB
LRPKQVFLFSTIGFILSAMLLFIVFGDMGLKDLLDRRAERDEIVTQNEEIFSENTALYRQMERLESDPEFIEATARKELNVVAPDERIITLK